MHLKRLELLGFKSFASKTILDLDRGITGVIGPNGCGKSNIVDAVRWALGEQSLKAVRSRKSEEVIFAGNSKRPAYGMAEVTMVFDNEDGTLPLPFEEVSVTRRHYRSGEGEYFINRARARLKDVVQLLTHASLGADGYAVVGQGAVDEVLLQRPEERRALLETAADISRYQMKMKESLDKLAQTEGNLQRIEDIRSEIGPRLTKLRTQANRAQKYEQLARNLRDLSLWCHLLRLRQCRDRAGTDMRAESERSGAVGRSLEEHSALRSRVEALRGKLQEEQPRLEAARERVNSLRLERARIEREAALAAERRGALERQRREAAEELDRAEKEQRELETQLDKLDEARSVLVDRERELRAELSPLESERNRNSSGLRLLQSQVDRVVAEQQSAISRRNELQARRAALAREAQRAQEACAESQRATDESSGRLAALEEQAKTIQAELDRMRSEMAEAEAARRDAQAQRRSVGEQLDGARKKERQLWEKESALRNRLSALQSLKEEHRGVSDGARAILQARLPGIRGTLSATLRVPKEYVTAVSAALGGAQGYVVSEGFEEGLEALRFLEKRTGRATIAPMRLKKKGSVQETLGEFRARLSELAEGLPFRGMASDLVSCTEDTQELCGRYLGLSAVIDDMPSAIELYRRLSSSSDGRIPFQIVTLEGQLLRSRGDMASAQNGAKDGSLLARETEMQTLMESAEQARAELQQAKAVVAEHEAAMNELSRKAGDAASALGRLQSDIAKRTSALGDVSAQVAKIEAGVEHHRTRVATSERDLSQSKESAERLEKDLAEIATREGDARGKLEQLREDLAEQQEVVTDLSGRLSRLQQDLSASQSRLREQDARTSAIADALRRAEERARRQQERVDDLDARIAELTSQPDQKAAEGQPTRADFEAADRLVAELTEKVKQLRDSLAGLEGELAKRNREMEAAREELSQLRGRAERSAAELSVQLREAARETETEIEIGDDESVSDLVARAGRMLETVRDLLEDAPVDDFPQNWDAAVARTESVRKEIAALGVINAEAPEEYRSVSERHSFLTTQVDDLRRAERTLRKAIDELKEVMSDRFQKSFEVVNAEFIRCFSTLFGGGTARLVLTQPDNPLEGGVDVIATPPGKRSGSLLGLSGGERALTAVALLFALMKVNPSPFCLLDEVDAALDESNVHRFCSMVKDLTTDTQFLVITHNRATMEMASALYGVSMLPDSTSRVVSLKLEEH